MPSTSDDFAWFADQYESWIMTGYCFTLISDIAPPELADRLYGQSGDPVHGIDNLVEPSQHTADESGSSTVVLGAAPLDDRWTLMAETNGYYGTTSAMQPLYDGRTVITVFSSANGNSVFSFRVNGDEQLRFEMLFPYARSGSNPNGFISDMQTAGFATEEDEDDLFEAPENTPAGLALAANLSGTALPPEAFDESEFLLIRVPRPS